MTILKQLTDAQASPEVPVNDNFESLEHQAVYGKRQDATSALTWGYYGGRWGGFSVANGTLTLTDASANYVVVKLSDGVISTTTATTNWNDTAAYKRVYKITCAAGAVTTVEDHRAGPGGVHGIGSPVQAFLLAIGDETTAITTGTNKVTFRMPYAFTLTGVRASLSTAQTSGATFTVDVNEAGVSILSTKLTIDNTEKTSKTAAAAAVISDTALADDAEITVDVDQVGDGTAKGLKVYLIGLKA